MSHKFYACFPFYILTLYMMSCNTHNEHKPGTFGYDLSFLQAHDSIVVLRAGDACVIVSPKYQGKVFTSGADGDSGKSFGWINYKAFTAKPDSHMNAYGGENRLWLGPEGGPYSLFFKPGDSMVFNNWVTPAAFDSEPWTIVSKSTESVSLHKEMKLLNYAGTTLNIDVNRSVKILTDLEIQSMLACMNCTFNAVGYATDNSITNTGTSAWDSTTGMPCIWILDMFTPSDHTTTIIPYNDSSGVKPATTDYFGEIPADRIRFSGTTLFFKADGKSRGKLGIHPSRATNLAGSYDAEKNVLTITMFDIENNAKYLNQEWKTDKPPFSGDAVNAYNDGPLAGGGQLGPFYELESVSPPAFLQPGGSLIHTHSVFHFTGDEKDLNCIAQKVLGVSIEEIKKAFE